MRKSVVKWWNVHYMTPEELEMEQAKEADDDQREAKGVGAPCANSADVAGGPWEQLAPLPEYGGASPEDEERGRGEVGQASAGAEAGYDYNEATGAYSGTYGRRDGDDEHQERIDAILAEKDEALRDLIEHAEEE